MSAAMINVGLMWESRYPIRNLTAQCLRLRYRCYNREGCATGPRLAGFAARGLALSSFAIHCLIRTALCGDGEADHLK